LSVSINVSFAHILYLKRDYDKAIEYCKKALEVEPNYLTGLYYLGFMYEQKGMYKEALEQFEKAKNLIFSSNIKGALGHYYTAIGEREKANELISELEKNDQDSEMHFNVALIYAGLGDLKQALKHLGECDKKEFKIRLATIRLDPRFE